MNRPGTLAHGILCSATVSIIIGCVTFTAGAAPVIDWHTFRNGATTLSGQGTDDPIVGSLATPADASFVIGYLSVPLTLASVGDQISFTFDVRFNDLTGMANAGDNFRFALFDTNGQARATEDNYATAGVTGQTNDFRGYIFGVRNGSGTGSGGSMRERVATLVSGDNAFAATGANAPTVLSLGTVAGDPVMLASSVNGDGSGPTYTGTMTLTLTDSGIDLSGSFLGTNGPGMNVFSAFDGTAPTSTNFGAVGFLIGGPLNVDEVSFGNVQVVPEPASGWICALAFAGLVTRRRRH